MARTTSRRSTATATSASEFAEEAFDLACFDAPAACERRLLHVIEMVHTRLPVDGRGVLTVSVQAFRHGDFIGGFSAPDFMVLDRDAITVGGFAHEYGHFVDCTRRLRDKWRRLVQGTPEFREWQRDEYLSHPSEMFARFAEQYADPRSQFIGRYSEETFLRLLPHFRKMVS